MSKKLFIVTMTGIGLMVAACTSSVPRDPAASEKIASSARHFKLNSSLDFPLYKNERYYQDSKEKELASFMEGGIRVWRAQEKIALSVSTKDQASPERRVFHAKQHGCLTGKLNLISNRPKDTERKTFNGIFDPTRSSSYDVIVRFFEWSWNRPAR